MNPDTGREEHVLTILREEFDSRNPFTGFAPVGAERPDLGEYLQSEPITMASFVPRSDAEGDERLLQLIPYITLVCNESVFIYRRAGSGTEERLHGQLSLGVGGHINDRDDPDSPFYAFLAGSKRELLEEVGLDLPHTVFQGAVRGLLFDDSTAVGRVHLGISIVLVLSEDAAKTVLNRCEKHIHEPRFVPIKDLNDLAILNEMENWARFVAGHLLEETSQDGKWGNPDFRERIGMLSVCAANLASAAGGFLLQDTPRGHLASKAMVEEAAGQVQCMLAGACQKEDVAEHLVKRAGKEFYNNLGDILKHQV